MYTKGPFNNYVDKMRGEGVKKCLFLFTLRSKNDNAPYAPVSKIPAVKLKSFFVESTKSKFNILSDNYFVGSMYLN